MKKVVKLKVSAQKWQWWSDNGKIFNKNNSGEFWCQFSVGGGTTNSCELLLLKFCHYQTTTATSGLPPLISQIFHAAFLHGPHLLLQFGWFCVDNINTYQIKEVFHTKTSVVLKSLGEKSCENQR